MKVVNVVKMSSVNSQGAMWVAGGGTRLEFSWILLIVALLLHVPELF